MKKPAGEAGYAGDGEFGIGWGMDQASVAQIAISGFGFAAGGALFDSYRSWKRGRRELVISKDWRGKPVVDRKLKLFERAFVWGVVVWTMIAAVISYHSLTS